MIIQNKSQTTTNSYSDGRLFNSTLQLNVKNNEKLNSIITQADYLKKSNLYSYTNKAANISAPFLGPQKEKDKGKKTLVLDLDETLVHSSFKPVAQADIIMPVEIESMRSNVYVMIRPGAHIFLE